MSDPAHHVADKLDITEQLARYARGVDTNDWDLWRRVFTDDAIIDYSSANGRPAAGRDDTADWLAQSMPFLPWKQHYITNVEIDLDGDTAHVRAAFYNPMQLPGLAEPSADPGLVILDLPLRIGIFRGVEAKEVVDVGVLIDIVAVDVRLVPGAVESVESHGAMSDARSGLGKWQRRDKPKMKHWIQSTDDVALLFQRERASSGSSP